MRPGIQRGEEVVDAARALEEAGAAGSFPGGVRDLLTLLDRDASLRDRLGSAAERLVLAGEVAGPSLVLGPPVTDPDKIICVGLNYRDHVAEVGRREAGHPTLFAKFRNSLSGPLDPIMLPAVSDEIDYEGELAIVIGRRGSRITVKDALDHVAGAMVVNDVTARDLQQRTTQWLAGKAIDSFLPSGPALVTLDELGDLTDLHLRTRVNAEVVQEASTAQLMFSVPELVADISQALTLEIGDIICTGTPGGVGFKRTPPLWLREGDVVEVEVDRIGTLVNRCVAPGG